jgi:peroxisomal enoyl-CoA hydratase 2
VAKFQTSPGQSILYRLNGDYNPLHIDPTVGPKMGFKGTHSFFLELTSGTILHGLCTYNIAAVQVLRAYGNSDPVNFKSFEARFSAPVIPGGNYPWRYY